MSSAEASFEPPQSTSPRTVGQLQSSYLFKTFKFERFYSSPENCFYKDDRNMYAICVMTQGQERSIVGAQIFNLRQKSGDMKIAEGIFLLLTDLIFGSKACIQNQKAVDEILAQKAGLYQTDESHSHQINNIKVYALVRKGLNGLQLNFQPDCRWKCANITSKGPANLKIASLFATDPPLQPIKDPQKEKIDYLTDELQKLSQALSQSKNASTSLKKQVDELKSASAEQADRKQPEMESLRNKVSTLERLNDQKQSAISTLQSQLWEEQKKSSRKPPENMPTASVTELLAASPIPQLTPEDAKYRTATFNSSAFRIKMAKKIRTDLHSWDFAREEGTVVFNIDREGRPIEIRVDRSTSEKDRKRLLHFVGHCAPFPCFSETTSPTLTFTASFHGQAVQVNYTDPL